MPEDENIGCVGFVQCSRLVTGGIFQPITHHLDAAVIVPSVAHADREHSFAEWTETITTSHTKPKLGDISRPPFIAKDLQLSSAKHCCASDGAGGLVR